MTWDPTKPIPVPPGSIPNRQKPVEHREPVVYPVEAPPLVVDAPVIPQAPTKLSDDETMFILRSHLRSDQITDVQLLEFIMSYLECRNARQAAKDVGLNPAKGTYTRNRPEVHACIEAITAKAVMKYGYDAAEVVERVKEIAALDPIEFENPDGSYKTHLSQIAPEARRAIKKFKVKNLFEKDANGMPYVRGQIIEVELYDKQKAHEMLAREKGVMKETKVVEHGVTRDMKSILLDSERRAETRLIGAAIDVTGSGDESESSQED